MYEVEVAIVGGGCAGSLTAAMLGKAGFSTVLIDNHEVYPPEFRCEKIHGDQAWLLRKTGLSAGIIDAATPIPAMWVCRRGRFVGAMSYPDRPYEWGVAYDTLVNATRRQIPADQQFLHCKAKAIDTGPDTQTVHLTNGELVSARLVVIAAGLNRRVLNGRVEWETFEKAFSTSIGFDIAAPGGFSFPALTYFAENVGLTSYMSAFPMADRMRVNVFTYHPLNDARIRQFRDSPIPWLLREMPGLAEYLRGTQVVSKVQVRPIDLCRAKNHDQLDGVVLIGDSFATSCPAAGTGLTKIYTDVERLCHEYIPQWLSTSGMGVEKIQAFYADKAKIACDEHSTHSAYYMRSMATNPTMPWRVRRVGWYAMHSLEGIRSWFGVNRDHTLPAHS